MNEKDLTFKKWVELADGDYKSAKHLLTMHPAPTEVVCYLCEQSAEKYLKAFLYVNNEEPPRTHDLEKLNKLCQKYSEKFSEILEVCSRLTPYGTTVRYPSNIEIIDEDMHLAIRDIEKIIGFISPMLESNTK